jgi:hypothetical protein
MSGTKWITTSTFNSSLVGVSGAPVKNTKRYNCLYSYPSGQYKELFLTVPNDPDSFTVIGAPVKKSHKKKDGTFFTPNKHTCAIMLDKSNPQHNLLIRCIDDICANIQSHTGIAIDNNIKEYNGKQCMFPTLIESNEGNIYTSFCTLEEYIDPKSVRKFIGRPCIGVSVNYETKKLYYQLSGAYIYRTSDDKYLATQE